MSVVFPASGCEMIAKDLRLFTSVCSSVHFSKKFRVVVTPQGVRQVVGPQVLIEMTARLCAGAGICARLRNVNGLAWSLQWVGS